MILEPFEKGERSNEYLCSAIYQPLADALYEMTKVKPSDPLEWLAYFMLEHNKNKPSILGTTHQHLQRVQTMKMKNIEDCLEEISSQQNQQPELGQAKCGCIYVIGGH